MQYFQGKNKDFRSLTISFRCFYEQDLCKYIRGELNAERELQVVQTIIGHALEREELRDEVLVQCMRQATNNPLQEGAERVWLLMCLCVVAFPPSKLLHRYFISFLKKNLAQGGRVAEYVKWCLNNCNNNKVTVREHPPSSYEVDVSKIFYSLHIIFLELPELRICHFSKIN